MRRAAFALLAGCLLAACKGSAPDLGAQLYGPTDLVAFRGITGNSVELRDYLAVASGRGNELRLVDLTSDKAVLGPTVVFPLSIPSATHPVRLAAASLGDGAADVVVAVSAGSAALELVSTWSEENKIVDVYDLAVEAPGAGTAPEVIAVAAAPIPGTPGQARIIAAFTGGKLAVVTAARAADGSIVLQRPAEVRDFGFNAVDLAVHDSHAAGFEGLWLFAATPDDLDPGAAEVFGVAQISIAGPPASWNAIALDARAPTRLVGAADLAERVTAPQAADIFPPTETLHVYAVLDPGGCGVRERVDCGLATLDPATRALAADPAGELDHRVPMPIPGVPQGLAISKQPAQLAADVCNDNYSSSTPDAAPPFPNARLRLSPGTGVRCTTAIAAVTSSDGFVYVFDLGRWGAPNDVSMLRGTTRTRALAVTQVHLTTDPSSDVSPLLALWDGDAADSTLSLTGDVNKWFTVTPGYTPTDRFHLGWKISLPQLTLREAVIGRLGTGEVYLASQAATGRTGSAGETLWALGAHLADPTNGVRVGDIVQVLTSADATCAVDANGAIPETTVAAVLPPDPLKYPGGAIAFAPVLDAGGQPVTTCWDIALAASSTGLVNVTFTIRSSGHMLYGERLGYLGRPEKDVRFTLAWQDESNPALTAEERSIARKLRRFYYPGAEKCDAFTPCPDFPGLDPVAPGPVLSFRSGWLTENGRTGPEPSPGDQLLIDTQSGVTQMARKPSTSGALPLGIWAVDRTTFSGPGGRLRLYVAYQDNQIYVFGPGESASQAFSIR